MKRSQEIEDFEARGEESELVIRDTEQKRLSQRENLIPGVSNIV